MWLGAGPVLARVPGFDSDLPSALLFPPLGFITGIIFSGKLVGIERGRGFDRASLPRFAGRGAASGLLLSGIFVVAAALRAGDPWGDLLLFGPPLAIAGALCATGSLAIARWAERRALPSDSGHPAVAALSENGPPDPLRRGE